MSGTDIIPGDATRLLQQPARYSLHCWGDFALLDPEGNQATPRSRKSRALLAWLAFHPDRPVSRERLAGLLWGDRGEEQARASLRQTLFELRALANGPEALLHIDRASVTLRGDRLERHACPDPREDEPLFANLDDIDESFDNWLRIIRAREPSEGAGQIALAPDPDRAQYSDRPLAAEAGRTMVKRSPLGLTWFAVALLVILIAVAAFRIWPGPAAQAGGQITLAVLPLEPGTSPEDSVHADLLAAELRRQFPPTDQMQTLGSFSSTLPDVVALSPVEAGRKLGATHVLSGSLTSGRSGTRVSVRLARTVDGKILWSDDFDVPVNGPNDLKDQIADGVLSSLGIAPGVRPAAAGRSDVHALVASARELVSSFEPAKLEAAVLLLRKAIALDPDDPRANAELAIALLDLRMLEPRSARDADRLAEATTHARRAFRLAPELAEAQAAMGFLLEWDDDPQASLPYYDAAVRLDPGRAGFWVHIANVKRRVGRYGESLAALRRAVALEPLWWPAYYQSAEMAWNLGNQAESLRISENTLRGAAAFEQAMVRSNIAWRKGDFSEAWRQGERAASLGSESQQIFAGWATGRALRAVRLSDRARVVWTFYPPTDELEALWKGEAPPPTTLANLERLWRQHPEKCLLLRVLVRDNRTADAARVYQVAGGNPSKLRTQFRELSDYLDCVPPLVLALRAQGKAAEADALLADARAAVVPILASGAVPTGILAIDAELLLLEGDRPAALARLDEATGRGWLYARSLAFADIGEEPTWGLLRGDPVFERIRSRETAFVARERAEILAHSGLARTN